MKKSYGGFREKLKNIADHVKTRSQLHDLLESCPYFLF